MVLSFVKSLTSLSLLAVCVQSMAVHISSLHARDNEQSLYSRAHALGKEIRDTWPESTRSLNARQAGASSLPQYLWDNNPDLVDRFMNNSFQDYHYLIDYTQYKSIKMGSFPIVNTSDLLSVVGKQALSIEEYVDYTKDFKREMIDDLKIPADTIDNCERNSAEAGYANWLQRNSQLDWYTMNVMIIPCIWGWPRLAQSLQNNDQTLTGILFYNYWISENNSTSYADELEATLNWYHDQYDSPINRKIWNAVFRQALKFEISLFESANGMKPDDCLSSN
ncbi:hypothetical protein BO83DRAFT_429479 [Aspergillus eucalypticola CBS 122712]|uniref:Thiaminase-2/PQQC domain-containing protein n=1 Tax=Aspergillus eucalypticola (strain CBS 122712 / IBT 29274) TaxID=1448314 RepID=A0A317V3E1_ASPEC|nr:uncharacterized protein BO83DRAFT_429479 [Aspergillus eucalypticola CBS 122712]PWY67861.1 hypothetical protein BO83DRAFT_429479 [Aspergillus eucalypticola CBS 122712]